MTSERPTAFPRRRDATPELEPLVNGVRAVVSRHGDWQETAWLVTRELERHLPPPEVLAPEQGVGSADGYRSHPLHIEPDGSFSIVALVWRPGQVTPIHDHVTWCVFGVVQGVEYEELFTLDERRGDLVPSGETTNRRGDVSGFAPPGDRDLDPRLRDRRLPDRLERQAVLRPSSAVVRLGCLTSTARTCGSPRRGKSPGSTKAVMSAIRPSSIVMMSIAVAV
jgi:3-mercaptopropionate dioxygenase